MGGHKALSSAPDEEDLRLHPGRCDAALLTARTHELVPFAAFVGGRVVQVSTEGATAEIPLLAGPMNQNGIHLASNHYFLADWVVALGVLGALPGLTVQGFHDPGTSTVAQIWTTRAEIDHLAAGTGTLRCRWGLDADARRDLRRQIVEGGSGQLTTVAEVTQDGRVVARVTIDQVVFAITPRSVDAEPNLIQAHQGHLSALLVAGLRADDASQALAGEQGRSLAQRMAEPLPQLPGLVWARTEHLDRWIAQRPDGEQVLSLGIGLDARAARSPGLRWFGVDLAATLKRRKLRFASAGLHDRAVLVAGDLRGDLWRVPLASAGFDPSAPTSVILEGVSMYLVPSELGRLLATLADWLTHPDSRLWMDHVVPDLLVSDEPGPRAFLAGMARLGEPFVTGLRAIEDLATPWRSEETASAADLRGTSDPVETGYRFAIARVDAARA
jgi:methyltransferase (TIGR00027 family)